MRLLMAALAAVGVSAFQASAADSLAVVTELVQAQCRATVATAIRQA